MLKQLLVIACLTVWLSMGWFTGSAYAQEANASSIDTGDTSFMLICSALVLLLTYSPD